MEAVPMKSSDAPYAPSLEALDSETGEYDVQEVGSQLLVKWAVPRNDSVDIYGDGGAPASTNWCFNFTSP